MFAVKKKDSDEWLMSKPGGRLDRWGPAVERAEYALLETAVVMRRLQQAQHYSVIVQITSTKDLHTYDVVRDTESRL